MRKANSSCGKWERKCRISRGYWLALAAGLACYGTVIAWGAAVGGEDAQARETGSLESLLPRVTREGGYVSSAECVSCHADEHASWHRTYHRTMTQVALPEHVAGEFDGSVIKSGGLPYRVSREGDEFWAEMPDPDVMMYVVQGGRELELDKIPRRRQRVVMTTGSHHYQTYWVASPRYERLLQTLPLVYLLEDKRWVPREEAFMRGPKDRGGFVTQWNHHCIRCHSTGGNPGLNPETGLLETRVGEFGIACEACHGPGEGHVKLQRSLLEPGSERKWEGVDPIVNPRKLDHERSSQVCGQCHGVYVMHDEFAMKSASEGSLFKPGEDLHATRYYIQHPTAQDSPERREELRRNPDFFRERWWDDGTILAGGREYTGLIASGCYQRGEISCLSCHSMHGSDPNDQLKQFETDNRQCTQCHGESKYTDNLKAHTFHREDSSGSNCLNCHMPRTTYALFKGIRSHQIVSPGLAGDLGGAPPNACNLCHLDQTLGWTQEHLVKWYGLEPVQLSSEQQSVSASLEWLLKGNAAYRAIAAWHYGWSPAQEASGRGWQAPHVARLLDDPYGVVRYVAARSLRTLPGFVGFEYDFLGVQSELEVRSRAAFELWRINRREGDEHRYGRVLMDERGAVRADAVAELLRRRDNRSVTIQE